jgi:hemoglobin
MEVAVPFHMSAPLPFIATTHPHFERLGGLAAVHRLVEAFYGAMDTRPDARAIRAMHAADLAPAKTVLVGYLAEWLGGPKLYTAEHGPPRLRRVHLPFAVDAAARDAWLACMQQALQETSADVALNATLLAAFARTADHIRNA